MNIDVTISIHALLAESDYSMGRNEKSFRGYFYPRSPCGERLRGWTLNINGPIFLSTLSLRRATPTQQRKTKTNEFLSTLSLRRATQSRFITRQATPYFYPRSPCGERLRKGSAVICRLVYFYPRSPCGERRAVLARNSPQKYFYPRSPCGERRKNQVLLQYSRKFLSTLSLRRATRRATGTAGSLAISIHALLAESDLLRDSTIKQILDFYPRSPCGERLPNQHKNIGNIDFYPRSPCGERR